MQKTTNLVRTKTNLVRKNDKNGTGVRQKWYELRQIWYKVRQGF